MVGLPEFGDTVRVWPRPGRMAHVNERPVDKVGGGRFISGSGEMVKWSAWHLEQMRSGDLMLHDPMPEEKAGSPKQLKAAGSKE